jgi:hypothetical protein
MKYLLSAVAVVGVLLVAPSTGASAQSAPYCEPGQTPEFVDGFAMLKAELGDPMGDPLECEHTNPENGDALQQTSTGLAFYRASANTWTFTNGYEHWALASEGLVYWTGESIDPPAIPPPAHTPLPPLVSGARPGLVVALTFDAGSDRGYAEDILDTLRDQRAQVWIAAARANRGRSP